MSFIRSLSPNRASGRSGNSTAWVIDLKTNQVMYGFCNSACYSYTWGLANECKTNREIMITIFLSVGASDRVNPEEFNRWNEMVFESGLPPISKEQAEKNFQEITLPKLSQIYNESVEAIKSHMESAGIVAFSFTFDDFARNYKWWIAVAAALRYTQELPFPSVVSTAIKLEEEYADQFTPWQLITYAHWTAPDMNAANTNHALMDAKFFKVDDVAPTEGFKKPEENKRFMDILYPKKYVLEGWDDKLLAGSYYQPYQDTITAFVQKMGLVEFHNKLTPVETTPVAVPTPQVYFAPKYVNVNNVVN